MLISNDKLKKNRHLTIFYSKDNEFSFFFALKVLSAKPVKSNLLLQIATKLLNAQALKNIFYLKHWINYSVA